MPIRNRSLGWLESFQEWLELVGHLWLTPIHERSKKARVLYTNGCVYCYVRLLKSKFNRSISFVVHVFPENPNTKITNKPWQKISVLDQMKKETQAYIQNRMFLDIQM